MNPTSLAANIGTWVALLVLLAITCGTSFVPMGTANLVINLAVAVAKALLVIVVFMRLTKSAPMVIVVALIAVFDLAVLVVLTLPDSAVRGG
jgi:cytochrome c oxidase subunit IV